MSPSPSLRLRGTAVGALTAALAVAAHGYGGGGLPSGMGVTALLLAAGVVGAVVAETSWLGRGWLPLLTALFGGQILGHLVLVAASGHGLDHSVAISVPMVGAHAAAAAMCAAAIELLERLYGPLTSLIRAVTSRPTPAPSAPRVGHFSDALHLGLGGADLHSLSRRGPPACA